MKKLLSMPDTQSKVNEFAAALDEAARKTVTVHTEAFLANRATYAQSELAMGEHLKALRDVLEPLGKWKAYLSLLPNLSQASAYRYIWRWENATRVLPPATLKVAAAEGFKLISFQKGKEFAPGYDKAFQRVVKRIGKPPAEDEAKARVFLDTVLEETKRVRKRPKKAVDENALRERVLKVFRSALARLPQARHFSFVQSVVAEIAVKAA